MKVVLYTNSVSAHQLPLAREIVRRVGGANFRYIYTEAYFQRGAQEVESHDAWVISENTNKSESREWLENCDILLSSNRALELFNRRAACGLKTHYQSERWFKPVPIGSKLPQFLTSHFSFLISLHLPGSLRMLVPGYRRMAKGFVRWLNGDPRARYLAIGPWAKKDMRRIGVREDKIVDWGYFVEPSEKKAGQESRSTADGSIPPLHAGKARERRSDFPVASEKDKSSAVNPNLQSQPLKILYIGRLIPLKRVDTIIRAVALANRTIKRSNCPAISAFTLTVVGDGPEKERLQKLSSAVNLDLPPQSVSFLPSVPIREVRTLMRRHDVLVFASNATDGWGAVVSEALAEGVPVIGTYETGASAALLPDAQLFHCGDCRELARKLTALHPHLHLPPTPLLATLPSAYTPSGAAERLLA